jgi:hypothetical protein
MVVLAHGNDAHTPRHVLGIPGPASPRDFVVFSPSPRRRAESDHVMTCDRGTMARANVELIFVDEEDS